MPRHEDRLLRLEPAVLLLERRGDLLPRPAAATSRARGSTSPSTSPTPSTGRATATSTRRTGRGWWSIRRRAPALRACSREAAEADVVVKASGVGVFDDVLLDGVMTAAAPGRGRASSGTWTRRRRWPRCAPSAGASAAPRPARARPGADLRRRRRRWSRPTRLRARARCVPIYNALDPATHHPGAARAALRRRPRLPRPTACPTARRASRRSSSTPAARLPRAALPDRRHRLGRQADARQRRRLGHVCTARPQRLQHLPAGGAEHRARLHGRDRLLAGDAGVRGGRRGRLPDHRRLGGHRAVPGARRGGAGRARRRRRGGAVCAALTPERAPAPSARRRARASWPSTPTTRRGAEVDALLQRTPRARARGAA